MSLDAPSPLSQDDRGSRVAIIAARFNQALVDTLLRRVREAFDEAGADVVATQRVPGSAELPCAASILARALRPDAIVVLGVVIAGDTAHHRVIGDSTASALQHIAICEQTPVVNGILVVENRAQAEARCGGSIDRGREFALAALEMARFKRTWTKNNP